MRAAIVKETRPLENRVAIVPDSLARLAKLGLEVVLESGAGLGSGFSDEAYVAKGARVVSREEALKAEIVLAVHVPAKQGYATGALLACMADPLGSPAAIAELAREKVSCVALELIPRISRAQAMDVLSSQANLAGYKAVLLGAARSTKLFPLLMTAAGTVRPAKVFVLGAGVAGLQAIATARRLGAVVEAFDIRPETKQEVESLGARFVELEVAKDGGGGGGYARELTAEEKARQAQLMATHVQAADVVVTTAQVPGRRAPRLIPADVVRGMKPGAVIVDMAAESGGNCELSRPGEEVVENGVVILGPANLPSQSAQSSSPLYSNNIVNFLALVVREGKLVLDLADEIVKGTLVCHAGEVTNDRVKELLEVISLTAPELIASITVLFLSIFLGFELISKVPPTLHTPLMSGSNAISGITIVGALVASNAQLHAGRTGVAAVLGCLALILATINVVGGFVVTDRMLRMFKRK